MLEKFAVPELDQSADWNHNLNKNAKLTQPKDMYDIVLRKQSEENIRSNIAGLAQCLVNNEGFQRGQLLSRWFTILGDSIGANARPNYIKNNNLFVTCSSPIWAQEISLHQADILERFNACLAPEHKLRKIICKVGSVASAKTINHSAILMPPAELNDRELEQVARIKSGIADPQLADLLAAAYAQSLVHNRQLQMMGAVECQCCHHLGFTGSPCLECRRRQKYQQRIAVLKILDSNPWTKYADFQSADPSLKAEDFTVYRLSLASSWREKIHMHMKNLSKDTPLPEELRVLMIKLVSLKTSKPYNEIQEGDVKYALSRRLENGAVSYTYAYALLNNKAPGTNQIAKK